MLMVGNKVQSAQQRLTKAIVTIMGNARYTRLAPVLMIGDRSIGNVPTACTNGRDEIYGEAFVDSLNDAELRFLVLHENYHKLYRHLHTWKNLHDKNHKLANAACDYVINIKLVDDNKDGFATMPEGGLLDERFRGKNAAEVFKILEQEQQQQSGQGNDSQDGDEGDESDIGQPGQPGKKPGNKSQGGDDKGTGFDDHDWDGAQDLSDGEKKELEKEINKAIRQGALIAGKTGSGADRDFDELMKTKIDWREVLREFMLTTCQGKDFSTWKRPNRRFIGGGFYMPSTVSEKIGEVVLAIDTSGSIGGEILTKFLTEVKAICDTVRPEVVRLLYWDTKVAGDEKYTGDAEIENLVKSTKPKGGGGTTPSCVSDYLVANSIKPQAVIMLTDGCVGGDWGNFNVPTLWCIVGNKSAIAPTGKTVHVED